MDRDFSQALLVEGGKMMTIAALEERGADLRPAIEDNLLLFWRRLNERGYARGEILRTLSDRDRGLGPSRLGEIAALASGSGMPFEDLLAYNLYEDTVFQEGCTVMAALGSTSASGNPILLKNSDKVGGKSLTGPNFHLNKEINVILDGRSESGHRIMAVAAAGSTGIKMGMNDAGVITGSNIGRTLELKEKKADLTTLRALDRGQIMRDGLEFDNAHAAADAVLSQLIRNPMSTPGNVEFLDKKECYIIEGSYTRFAVDIVRGDRVAARANHFILLHALNDPADIAGHKRYARCLELLNANAGQIDRRKMIDFSCDHANGPGPNSICRHGKTPEEETSLSAMVMELEPERPKKSLVTIAMGKPCHAWRDPEGHVTLSMDCKPEEIPQPFLNGEVWKRLYTEEPRAA
ncbi:MAG: C45 family autoproteolytic acyltransferase/hydrolase [Nitrospinota bacterium]